MLNFPLFYLNTKRISLYAPKRNKDHIIMLTSSFAGNRHLFREKDELWNIF